MEIMVIEIKHEVGQREAVETAIRLARKIRRERLAGDVNEKVE